MKSKKPDYIYRILLVIAFCYVGYQLGTYINYQSEIRQLTKDKLRLEIQLLKIETELNEIELQKEY